MDDDDDAVCPISVCALLESPSCGSVGDVKGSEVTAADRYELSVSVVRWLLQKWDSFSPTPPCGLRVALLSLVVQGGSSGGEEEVSCGMLEVDRVG